MENNRWRQDVAVSCLLRAVDHVVGAHRLRSVAALRKVESSCANQL